jgi:hypothetical protein
MWRRTALHESVVFATLQIGMHHRLAVSCCNLLSILSLLLLLITFRYALQVGLDEVLALAISVQGEAAVERRLDIHPLLLDDGHDACKVIMSFRLFLY